MTTLEDTLYYADGSKANGQVVVDWPMFQSNGTPVAAGQEIFPVVNGQVQLTLYPNAAAFPAGTYYTARFELENGPVSEEYWIFPNQPQVTLPQVRVGFPPAPGLFINTAQLTSSGAQAGEFLGWNGTQWVPMYVSTLNISPNTVALAVTKTVAADIAVLGSPAMLGQTLTINIPDAGATSRGVVTTGAQSFAGTKNFLANLGVANTAPAYPLDVVGDINCTGAFRVNGAPMSSGVWQSGSGGAIYYNGGNVGIGTGSPTAILHTSGPAGTLNASLSYGSAAAVILNTANVDLAMGVQGLSPYPFWLQARNNSNAAVALALNPLGGNVGIATTGPAYKLDVSGDINTSGAFRVAGVALPTTLAGFQTPWTSDINAANHNLTALNSINSGGTNLGIGTGNPQVLLDVNSNAAAGSFVPGLVTLRSALNGAVNEGSSLDFTGNNNAVIGRIACQADGLSQYRLTFSAYSGSAAIERMRITSAGNVGIGTASPNALLHVYNAAAAVAGGQLTAILAGQHNGSIVGSGVSLQFSDQSNNNVGYLRSYTEASGVIGLSIGTYNSGSRESVHITGPGLVGIGTASPLARLHADVGMASTATIAGLIYGTTNTATFTGPGGLTRSAATLVVGTNAATSAGAILNCYSAVADGMLYVSASGNVGIGTPNPLNTLSVIAATNPTTLAAANQFTVGENTNNSAYRLILGYYNDGGTYKGVVQATNNGPGPLLLQPSGGNVGIGLTAPAQLLHLTKIVSGGVGPVIRLDNSQGALHDAGAVELWDSTLRGQLRMSVEASPYGADFIFFSGSAGTTEVARITSAGLMGIGKSAPAYALDVAGDCNITGTYRVNGTAISTGGATPAGATSSIQWNNGGVLAGGISVQVAGSGIALGFSSAQGGAMGSTLLWLATDNASKPNTNTWTVSSDIRLKHRVRDFAEGLATIRQIKPIRYAYNGKAQTPLDSEGVGIDAGAHKDLLPDCIGTHEDDLDGVRTPLYTFNSHAILFMMINAFKELAERIEKLEKARLN